MRLLLIASALTFARTSFAAESPPLPAPSTSAAPPASASTPPSTPSAAPSGTPAATAPATPAPATTAPPQKQEEPFHPLALTLNPLSLLLGRYGLNVEYVFVPHHGVILNPYGWFSSAEAGSVKSSYTNYGAELGYHFYSGTNGASGFFVGPSALYMTATATTEAGGAKAEVNFSAYGLAVDLGGQAVTKAGFTIGAGVGVMYLKTSTTSNLASGTFLKWDGVLPRFLFTIGWSF